MAVCLSSGMAVASHLMKGGRKMCDLYTPLSSRAQDDSIALILLRNQIDMVLKGQTTHRISKL